MILSLRPSAFDPIFGWFDVQPGDERRLIFVLVLAVLVLFFLLLGVQSEADTNERSIRMLVEALGRERFDWARAAALPEGRRLVVVSPAYNEEESVGDVLRRPAGGPRRAPGDRASSSATAATTPPRASPGRPARS